MPAAACSRLLCRVSVWAGVFARSAMSSDRVFANGPGDWDSISGRVIPKTQKMVLDSALLITQYYKVRIKVKWSNPRNGVAPSPPPRCSSY